MAASRHTYLEQYSAKQDILRLKQEGKSMDEIKQYLTDEYGYAPKGSKDIIRWAGNELKAAYEEYLKEAAQYQWQRLDKIVTDCLNAKDYKNALRAIDLQSKISKLYDTTIVNNTQINTDTIEITFS